MSYSSTGEPHLRGHLAELLGNVLGIHGLGTAKGQERQLQRKGENVAGLGQFLNILEISGNIFFLKKNEKMS